MLSGVDLLGLVREVAANERCPASVRRDAARFLEHRRVRAEPAAAADGGRDAGFSEFIGSARGGRCRAYSLDTM
jgi:hypothetical protein